MASKFKLQRETFFIFCRAQFSAFIGGISDYLIMMFLSDVAGVFYPIAIIISGVLGAVINFSLNRYWAFRVTDVPHLHQLRKFLLVVGGSILLKSAGTYLVTNLAFIDYRISRLVVDLIVSLAFNFTLQKYWVFKGGKQPDC